MRVSFAEFVSQTPNPHFSKEIKQEPFLKQFPYAISVKRAFQTGINN